MHRHRFAVVRRRMGLVFLVLFLIGLIFVAIEYDLLHHNKKKVAVSEAQIRAVNGDMQTFRTAYFQFQDSGKWVLNTKESTDTKFVYYKFRGLAVEHRLTIYVNQVPIPNDLATSRVLPVRVVNGNNFDVTSISGPCGNSYGPQELHKIRVISINGADMLCDPDTPQYTVVLGEINGNYQLHLQRSSGNSVQFIITYRDQRLNTGPDTILRVADSFQAL